MSGAITEFTSVFGGGARPNRYKITIPQLGSTLEFFAKASSLPGSTLGKCEVPYMGRIVNVSGDRTFDDWTITVINDISFDVRTQALTWMANLQNQRIANSGPDAPSAYYRTAIVEQLSRSNTPIATITIYDMFPISVGEITLGYDQNDQVEEYDITFAYNYWTGTGGI